MNQIIRTTPRIHPLMAAAAASVIVVSAAGVGVMTGVLPGSHANVQPAPIAMAAPASLAPAPFASASPAPAAAPQIIVQAAPATATPKAAAPKPRVTRVAAVQPDERYDAPMRTRQPMQVAGNAPRSGDPYEPNPYGNAGGNSTYGGAQGAGNGGHGGYGGYGNAPVQVTQAPPVPAPVARPVCGNCGVIEAITENTVAGAGTGIGGIGGALGGAVIGKQFGKGRGSDALAILGAIGGAVAGHQVEKSVRSTKVYEVRVKMEDGSTRSMTQSNPPAWRNGDRVRVDGNSISVI